MKSRVLLCFPGLVAAGLLCSCEAILDSMIDSAFESKRDRNIREDSDNLEHGRPLKHYSTERRLKLDREDRLYEDLRSGD